MAEAEIARLVDEAEKVFESAKEADLITAETIGTFDRMFKAYHRVPNSDVGEKAAAYCVNGMRNLIIKAAVHEVGRITAPQRSSFERGRQARAQFNRAVRGWVNGLMGCIRKLYSIP